MNELHRSGGRTCRDPCSILVDVGEAARERWQDDVFVPQINGRKDALYKGPGRASVE
jgi:hypothetical protein